MAISESDQIALVKDDMEILRTRVLRTLLRQVELLDEGLQACRNGKPHILEDHADRAADALKKEIQLLKGSWLLRGK